MYLLHQESSNNNYNIAVLNNTSRADRVICVGCGFQIREKFLLKVADDYWHENCLKCSACSVELSNCSTCFVKDGQIYCRDDHAQLFSTICARCGIVIHPTDYVFRCLDNIYHAACFCCTYCNQLLKKGDHYFVIDDDVVCRCDYELLICNQTLHSVYFNIKRGEVGRKTLKRPRTILNSQQRRAFKIAFDKSAKPCRKIREQLAKETGLSVRVVQVWFQNQRAKMKKISCKQEVTKGLIASECDTKSTGNSKSNLNSEDSTSSDDEVENAEDRGCAKLKVTSNPIDKLYNMQAAYFDCV